MAWIPRDLGRKLFAALPSYQSVNKLVTNLLAIFLKHYKAEGGRLQKRKTNYGAANRALKKMDEL